MKEYYHSLIRRKPRHLRLLCHNELEDCLAQMLRYSKADIRQRSYIHNDKDNFTEIYNYFHNNEIEILCGDFVEACRTAKAGDFVYFDPPYDVLEEKLSFTAYSKFDFNRDDQLRLCECFRDLTKKGVNCLLSNSNTKFINTIYNGFNIKIIKAKRAINSKGDGRGDVEEVLIKNYGD